MALFNINQLKINSRKVGLFLALILFLQLSIPAAFAKYKKPIIDPKEKMEYVNINWWDNYSDPCLKYYIIKAIENNHELRMASWQVEEFRQMVKVQFAQELPTISTGATYVGLHIDQTNFIGRQNIFSVPFIATYEPDLWLKNRDKTKSSKKTYEASKYEEQSTYIALVSDVATTYINLIKFDKQIKLQQDYVCVKKEELLRENEQYKRGTVSVPKLNNAAKNYEAAKSSLDELLRAREKSLTQLAVFIGDSPDNIACLKRGSFDNLEYIGKIPCEICSDVIFSRPDVLAAETNLQKARIDIRVARKEFLPRFNIAALYAFTNLDGNFFSWNSAVAAILAGATQDIFTGGRKIANLRINKAKYEEMFENYRQTDLNAIKEVSDSLLIIDYDTKVDLNTCATLQLQRDNYCRACKSLKAGVISIPDMLSEKEQLIAVEQAKVTSKATRLVDYITLYKSVGGKL